MPASFMRSAEYLLPKTYQILCFFLFFWNVAEAETEQWGKVGNKQNDKNWFYQRTGEHY